jgi:circadian clock protein KaiB
MNGERFTADVRSSGEHAEIQLQGELDDASAAQARAAVDEALARPIRTLVLDLGGLAFMDSAGIWLVIETHRRCVEAGIDLRLSAERRPAVTHALELAGVDKLIQSSQSGQGDGHEERVLLRLYMSSQSPTGGTVAQAFRAAAGRLPPGSVQMEVIDVFDEPARAQRDRVIATPTLIKVEPQPELRLIGSIGDEDAILRYLGLGHLAA